MTVRASKSKTPKVRAKAAEKLRPARKPLAKAKASRKSNAKAALKKRPSKPVALPKPTRLAKPEPAPKPPTIAKAEAASPPPRPPKPEPVSAKKKHVEIVLHDATELALSLSLDHDESHGELQLFKERRRPGPPPADAISAPERDLKDASLILDVSDHGGLFPREKAPEVPLDDKFHDFSSRLTSEEECHLALRIQQQGDIDARNTLVLANIGLVHLIANQFRRPHLRYEDLLQEGTMGLIRATETFEPARNVRFSTYSVYWIRAKIQRHIQRLDKDDVPSISGAELVQSADGGRAKRPRARKLSIEYSVEGDGGSKRFGELLASDINNPEELAMQHQRDLAIKQVLEEIVAELGDDRLTAIIEGRLLADEPATLTELGEKLNLSREGARLLESKMIKLARLRLSQWHD